MISQPGYVTIDPSSCIDTVADSESSTGTVSGWTWWDTYCQPQRVFLYPGQHQLTVTGGGVSGSYGFEMMAG